jgi:hypothetical protein
LSSFLHLPDSRRAVIGDRRVFSDGDHLANINPDSLAETNPAESRSLLFHKKKLISCFAARILLAYKEETKGGESMKIKVNVRAGGGKARA